MNKNISKKGFTIIEVVLVLAIAGLIFLMVFVALPRLQSSQRDTQRRDDVAAVATAITQYQTNNNGKLPDNSDTNASTFIQRYLLNNGATFNVPNSEDGYTLLVKEATTNTDLATQGAKENIVVIVKKATCGDDGELTYTGQTKDYAVGIKLEGSGYYCTDN